MADNNNDLLFLGGLPGYVSQDDVLKHLSIYGRISEVNLREGFVFVRFEFEQDARDCVKMYTNRPFLSSNCSLSIAKPFGFSKESSDGPENPSPRRSFPVTRSMQQHGKAHDGIEKFPVVVDGLVSGTNWKDLHYFGRIAGEVLFVAVDKYRLSRGYINYVVPQGAEEAAKKLNGTKLLGNVVSVAIYKGNAPSSRGSQSVAPARPGGEPRSRSRSPTRKGCRPDLKRNDHQHRSRNGENRGSIIKRELTDESMALRDPLPKHDRHGATASSSREPLKNEQNDDMADETPPGLLARISPAIAHRQLPDLSAEN